MTLHTSPAPPGSTVRDEPAWDRRGGLGITERRSWATWQLAVGVLVACLIGMFIGYSGKGPAKPGQTTGGLNLALPPPTTKATTSTVGISAGAPPTSEPSSSTTATTSAPTGPPTGTGPVVDLVRNTVGAGPGDLPAFTTAGRWQIGWAFSCVQAPGGSALFQIAVVPEGAGATTPPAVSQTSRAAQGVTPQAANAGRQHLHVDTDPACRWAVHVTGVAG